MPGGRPTDYNKETIPKTLHYLENYKEYGDMIPSVAGLSIALGVNRDTIYEWSSQDSKKEFSDILKSLLSTQEKVLINNGLNNTFNSQITKLVLGKHGYSDKQEITGKDGEKLFNEEAREKSKQAISSFLNDEDRRNT